MGISIIFRSFENGKTPVRFFAGSHLTFEGRTNRTQVRGKNLGSTATIGSNHHFNGLVGKFRIHLSPVSDLATEDFTEVSPGNLQVIYPRQIINHGDGSPGGGN